jgi:hypothetical protein
MRITTFLIDPKEKHYKFYPRRKRDGEPNLNPWWAMWYRQIDQWIRRNVYWKIRFQKREELDWEWARVSHPDILTPEARRRIGELCWILGEDRAPYRHTPEQSERIAKFDHEIMAEVITKERRRMQT